jgi:hypothetical protein
VQEIAFISAILIYVYKRDIEEYRTPKVQNEHVNRINGEAAEAQNSDVDATAIKKRTKRN